MRILSTALFAALTLFSATSSAAPTLNGSFVELPDNGWYQVQDALTYQSICQGVRRCEVQPGKYIVINHSTGERFSLSAENQSNNPDNNTDSNVLSVTVSNNTIQWPNDGWYQVQNAQSYQSVCEGGLSCEVSNGKYIVINHISGKRLNVEVTGGNQTDPNNGSDAITVSGNTIQWPNNGWYQVQDANSFNSICSGGQSCDVPAGKYIVINHSTGDRFDNIIVNGDTTTPPTQPNAVALKLKTPSSNPANCIGSVDKNNTRYCANPETRQLTAASSDGSQIWSISIAGDSDTNQIETVLTTNQWVVVIADRFPTTDSLTPTQRANQYEASVFNKNGDLVRTKVLEVFLDLENSTESRWINTNWSKQQYLEPLRVVATESVNGSPQLLIGYHRWPTGSSYDFAGIATFDMNSGDRINTETYLENRIEQLSLLSRDDNPNSDRDIVRVVTTTDVEWRYVDTLELVSADMFATLTQDALMPTASSSESQLNGSNYQKVIDRVLPWINAEPPKNLLYGDIGDNLPALTFPIPLADFSYVSQTLGREYLDVLFRCNNGGNVLNGTHQYLALKRYVLDECQLADDIYSGKMLSNAIGRDGFATRGENLKIHHANGSVTQATIAHGTGYYRTYSGGIKSFSGAIAQYGESPLGMNVATTNYNTQARFAYDGPSTPSGRVTSEFTINADWTSYSSLEVSSELILGSNDASEFYYSDGSVNISATDGSRILLTPIGTTTPSQFQVAVFDKNGNQSGNFANEFVNIKCEERIRTCSAP